MKIIAVFGEVRDMAIYCQLYFAEYLIVELKVDQNIIGTFLQPIFYPNHFQLFRLLYAYLFDLFINSNNFILLRGNFAAHEISESKGKKIRWSGPRGILTQIILRMKLFGDIHQAMNQPIKIGYIIAMNIFNDFG